MAERRAGVSLIGRSRTGRSRLLRVVQGEQALGRCQGARDSPSAIGDTSVGHDCQRMGPHHAFSL